MLVYVLRGGVMFPQKLVLAADPVDALSIAEEVFPGEAGLTVRDETTDVLAAFSLTQEEIDTLSPGVLVIRREGSDLALRSVRASS